MSDVLDQPLNKPARDEKGRLLPGHSMGGRTRLPDEFRKKGPELLAAMLDIAQNGSHEHQFKALQWCVEKIYGRPQIEVESTLTNNPMADALASFASNAIATAVAAGEPEGTE